MHKDNITNNSFFFKSLSFSLQECPGRSPVPSCVLRSWLRAAASSVVNHQAVSSMTVERMVPVGPRDHRDLHAEPPSSAVFGYPHPRVGLVHQWLGAPCRPHLAGLQSPWQGHLGKVPERPFYISLPHEGHRRPSLEEMVRIQIFLSCHPATDCITSIVGGLKRDPVVNKGIHFAGIVHPVEDN